MKKLALIIVTLATSAGTCAHHSFSAEFDSERMVTVAGIVAEVRFRNPHVQYLIDVEEDGELQRWIVAGHTMILMRRSGITAETAIIGDRITATGYAGRNGAKKVYLESLDTPDGKRYTIYGNAVRRAVTGIAAPVGGESNLTFTASLVGDWAFDVGRELPGAPLHLQFEQTDDGLRAILDNEVINVVISGDEFSLVLNRENLASFPAKLLLTGKVIDDEIQGNVEMIAGFSNYPELDAETFNAVRTSPERWEPRPPAPEAPVDITGVWERSIVLGPLGRTNAHLNEAGKTRHAEFQRGAYDPLLRCMNIGPMRRQARRGNMEILATTNRLTMLYANGNGIRRIWLERKAHSASRDRDSMGESLAHWDGSTLVIDTRNLSGAVLSQNLEPISGNARIVERLWLNGDGELVMEATLHDPTYYERPVARRLQWRRSGDTELLFAPCDPDSFYRGLQFDGVLDEYFEHQPDLGQQ
jgi:hypothetical protein